MYYCYLFPYRDHFKLDVEKEYYIYFVLSVIVQNRIQRMKLYEDTKDEIKQMIKLSKVTKLEEGKMYRN